MDVVRTHPGLTSFVGGTLFALLLVVVGGGSGSIIGVALAVILGAVFGASMYGAALRTRRPPPT